MKRSEAGTTAPHRPRPGPTSRALAARSEHRRRENQFAGTVLPSAVKAWSGLRNRDQRAVCFEHSRYLKVRALTAPRLAYVVPRTRNHLDLGGRTWVTTGPGV